VREFFLALPPDSAKKLSGFVAVLPVLAELDPAFAAQALDRGRLVAAVEGKGNPVLSRFFAGWLCYSLVMVLEALANNHFAKIARFLALPEIHADSYWSGLMPKILLATLHRKVVVMRDLARKVPPGRAD
jgi:hypothetical protein